jgi:hypothetical protein
MIPKPLRAAIESQTGNFHRLNVKEVFHALNELGIDPNSQFGIFFREYVVTFFRSQVSDEELCDLLEPSAEILVGTKFVHDVWGLGKNFVCLTNIQGEGAYLYDIYTGCVWDFDLRQRDNFLSGKCVPKWSGFFDFLSWYFSVD